MAPVIYESVVDPMGYEASFRETQREYTKMVRWADIEAASQYVHPEVRDQFLAYEHDFDAIRITDFDIGAVEFGPGMATAEIRVTYHAYSLKTMLETEIKETQRWERPGRTATWVVRPNLEGLVEKVADLR
jgi:hypothetical protein